jgi:hypothetical protein
MPAAIPIFATGVAGAAIAGTLTTEVLASLLFTSAIGGALAQNQIDKQKAALKAARDRGSEVNVIGSAESLPVIYGHARRISGVVVCAQTSRLNPSSPDDNAHFLNLIICWGEGRVDAIDAIWADDWQTGWDHWSTQDGIRVLDAVSYGGADDQPADPGMVYNSGLATVGNGLLPVGAWTTDHRLAGVAYTRVVMGYNTNIFRSVPTFTADIFGITPVHPVTGLPTARRDPAWAIYDYMTNTRYGLGFDPATMDVTSFDEASAYCSGNRFQCDGLISPDDDPLDNLRALLSSCMGFLIQSGGMFKLRIDKAEAATFDLLESHCVGNLHIVLDAHGTRYNRVRAEYLNTLKRSKPDFAISDSPTYRTTDGGAVLQLDLRLPMTTVPSQARRIAETTLKLSRYQLRVEVSTTLAGLAVEVGDVITFTHSVPGWTQKKFRVLAFNITSTEEVRLTLIEYNDDAYNIDGEPDDEEPPGTELANPFDVHPPVIFTLTPIRDVTDDGYYAFGIDAAWSPSTSTSVAGYDLEWAQVTAIYAQPAADTWTAAYLPRGDTAAYALRGLASATIYTVRIRARHALGMTSSWQQGWVQTLRSGRNIEPLPNVSVRDDGGGAGLLAWSLPNDPRVTQVEIWEGVSPDFHDAPGPGLIATVPASVGYRAIGFTGGNRYYWLRARSASGALSTSYTPSENGAGLRVTG